MTLFPVVTVCSCADLLFLGTFFCPAVRQWHISSDTSTFHASKGWYPLSKSGYMLSSIGKRWPLKCCDKLQKRRPLLIYGETLVAAWLNSDCVMLLLTAAVPSLGNRAGQYITFMTHTSCPSQTAGVRSYSAVFQAHHLKRSRQSYTFSRCI